MPHYKLHAVYKRNQYNPDICHWVMEHSPKKTFTVDNLTFLISEEESFVLQNEYRQKSCAFQVCWIVKRPGGKVFDRLMAVRFFHSTPALIFKLSRA